MTTVRQLLLEKGTDVWSVTPDESVFKALEVMAEHRCGALLVLEEGALAGIVSERDYARKLALEGERARNTPVREIMTKVTVKVGPSSTLDNCMALMTTRRVRHLPVLNGAELVGVISIGDVVKSIISEREMTIRDLETYITGYR